MKKSAFPHVHLPKEQLGNMPSQYVENKLIMADVSPLGNSTPFNKKDVDSFSLDKKSTSLKDRAQGKLPHLQPLQMLREQIIRRQLKVNENIEETRKNSISSSNSLERSSALIGNQKGLNFNDYNKILGSPQHYAANQINTPLSSATPKSSYHGTPFPLINQSNLAKVTGSPLIKFGIPHNVNSPTTELTPPIEELDSTVSIKSSASNSANNIELIKRRRSKKIQNIFRVITMMNKKLKIKKKDKDTEFFNRYIKEYENVDTYFNVRQVFQSLNPLNNPSMATTIKTNEELNNLSPSQRLVALAAMKEAETHQRLKDQRIEEDENDNISSSSSIDRENHREESLYGSGSAASGGKSAFFHSQHQNDRGPTLLKELKKKTQFFQEKSSSPKSNHNQIDGISPKKKSHRKPDPQEEGQEFFLRVLKTFQNSYSNDKFNTKEGEEMEANAFYNNLYKELMDYFLSEQNQQELKDQFDINQQREIERINVHIKKIHEQSELMNKIAVQNNQSIIEHKYQEFKKISDQAIKLIRKGGYQIYKQKIKSIEEEEKKNRQIKETIDVFEEFNKKLKYKPLHHQHFSHKRADSSDKIPTNTLIQANDQSMKKSNSVNVLNAEKRKTYLYGANQGDSIFKSQKFTQSSDFQRRSSVLISSQYNQQSSSGSNQKLSPRKTKDFKDQKESARYSKASIEDKISSNRDNKDNTYITSIRIEDQSANGKSPINKKTSFHQNTNLNIDMNLVDEYTNEGVSTVSNTKIESFRKSNSQRSIIKNMQSNNTSANEETEGNGRYSILQTLQHKSSKLSQQSSFNQTSQSNIPTNTMTNLNQQPTKVNRLNSVLGISSHMNSETQNRKKASFSQSQTAAVERRESFKQNSVLSPRNSFLSRVNSTYTNSKQTSPKGSQVEIQNKLPFPNESPQNKNNGMKSNLNEFRRGSLQHKTVFISNPSSTNKLKRINSLSVQEKQGSSQLSQFGSNGSQPKASTFSKEQAPQLSTQNMHKAKNLINQIFHSKPDQTGSNWMKEDFFPSLDFIQQNSYINLGDTVFQKHSEFCTAVEKRNKDKLSQYKQMQSQIKKTSQSKQVSKQISPSSTFNGLTNPASFKLPHRNSQQSTFYSSKSPLIILKDQLRKATAFQQKYSNKVQNILYDLDFVQEENLFVKSQMVKTVLDSSKSFDHILQQNYPELDCIQDLYDQSSLENKNKKPFIQKTKTQNTSHS